MDPVQLWEEFRSPAVAFAINIVAALAVFVIGRWIAKALTNTIKKILHKNDVEDTLESFVGNIVYLALMACVVLAALTQLGVATTSIIAMLGAAGLAIGLALQGSLSNFAAGVLIILFKPYRVGDYVEAAGVGGSVKAVQIFNTVLTTPDNKEVVIPNSQVTGGVITNYSANATRRLDLTIGITYSDDIDKAKATLQDIIENCQSVLPEPATTIAIHTLADSSVNIVVRPWVKTSDYWTAHFELTETIKKRFDAEGIGFPFPQIEVHVAGKQEA